MKYIEYIWLAGALMLVGLLISLLPDIPLFNMVAILAAISIFAFMYSFRRNQRIAIEKKLREEEEELERAVNDDSPREITDQSQA